MFKAICDGLFTDLMIKTNKLMKAGIPREAIRVDEASGKDSRVWWTLSVAEGHYKKAMGTLGLLVGEES